MKHIRVVSRRPERAQIEQVNLFLAIVAQVIGILSSAVGLASQVSSVFGVDLPQKGGES